MPEDYRALLKSAVLDDPTFVHLTASGKISPALPWRRIVVRPILLKDRRHLQFSRIDLRQDHTHNYLPAEADAQLDEVLALPFHSFHLRLAAEDITVQITRKGRAIVHRTPAAERQPDLSHDSPKELPLPPNQPDPFLQRIGIMNAEGRVRASMQDKFRQINEFLKLLDHTGTLEGFDHSPVRILDCGCGSAHLSFAVYHYLNHIRSIPATLDGVDMNVTLMAQSTLLSRELDLPDVCFYASSIADYEPAEAPDIVLALHACDTATDDALALAIRQGAAVILSAPCCHKDLNRQLEARDPFGPVMRHGILKHRLADILTDSFRAQILRIMGYRTDVIEFISTEHTARNLMIRAVRRRAAGDRAALAEYAELKAFWGVTPYLETLLGADFPG